MKAENRGTFLGSNRTTCKPSIVAARDNATFLKYTPQINLNALYRLTLTFVDEEGLRKDEGKLIVRTR